MKVSELWLREWVSPPLTSQELAMQLTMAGLEVDEVIPVAGAFDKVIVAEVLTTVRHPQADKLSICEVNTGSEVLQIVCGAANVRPGLKVALALTGAHLPGDFVIKETKLRGERSQGMLCSGAELGLEEKSEGIIELPQDAVVGMDLRTYMMLDDNVLAVDLTPNRADCFSILGIAREVAAFNQCSLSELPCKEQNIHIKDELSVQVLAPSACPNYVARIIRGIRLQGTTPLWLKERLRRAGIRSVHPVVDVTNYVMLELGQPMHAFDAKSIKGGIHVRFAMPKETLTLLNESSVTLRENVLVIADDQKPLALAGVMGGFASAVHEETTDIFLESAFFSPLAVAGVARSFGLSSDSSQRFERGVDPKLQIKAIERATELIVSVLGGDVGPLTEVCHKEYLPSVPQLSFNPTLVKKITGLDVDYADMACMLEALGFRLDTKQDLWWVDVPSHRFDIQQDVDLVEEIVRLYGYDKIEESVMISSLEPGRKNAHEVLVMRLASFFRDRAYHEAIHYSFVDPKLQEMLHPGQAALSLLNPISPELSTMRVSLWPGLIASAVYNVNRQQSAIKLFEVGVIFDASKDVLQEKPYFAGLITGMKGHLHWSEKTNAFDFYDMKGDLESLNFLLHRPAMRLIADSHPALHPGQSARIVLGTETVGWMGVLHPRIAKALDFVQEVVLFELSLELLFQEIKPLFHSISKYPQIRRDLSLLMDEHVTAEHVETRVRAVVPKDWLKAYAVFDVYQGDSIPEGKKSMAIALTLQDTHKTLIDEEINTVIHAIIKKLEEELSIQVRDAS